MPWSPAATLPTSDRTRCLHGTYKADHQILNSSSAIPLSAMRRSVVGALLVLLAAHAGLAAPLLGTDSGIQVPCTLIDSVIDFAVGPNVNLKHRLNRKMTASAFIAE